MAITVKHLKVSTIPDSGDDTLIEPSDWNADHELTGTIPVANGGTGAATLTGYVKGNGTSAMTAASTIPNTDITGLGTASTKDAGSALGVATLDASGKVPVSELPAAVLGALSYQGTWDASTNSPTLTSSVGTKGYYYVVSVAGNTDLNGITDWLVGDWAVYNGSAWQKIDNTETVTSVNGQTGAVVLTTTNIAEGTNEYYTDARARAALSAGTGISYNSTTGVITNSSPSLGGDVVGPASATDNAIARYDTTTGKLIQNSTVTVTDNGDIANANSVDFDITPTTLPTAQGTLFWDSADSAQTLSLVMEGGNAVQQIGEETYFRIKCSAAVTEGQVVMFTGTVGSSGGLTGAPATGLTASTASYVMGVATESGALNDWIYVTAFGLVRGIDTTGGAEAWVDGQILYYNPAVTGGLTKTLPSAPNAKVQVCAVVHADNNGSLFIRPAFGGILGQYEGDVQVTSPANGQLLVRNQDDGKWVNATLTDGTGISVTEGAGSVTITNTAPDQTVVLTAGTGISTSGTYPSFTVTNTAPDQTVSLTGGTGISTSGTYPNFTITNTSPSSGGTVTSVGGTGTVSGISLSGTVTSSGNLTLGGTLDLSSPPAIGGTAPNSVAGTVIQATNGIVVNSNTVSASYTIPSGSSAMSAGPMTVASGQTVTVSSGSRWVVL